MLFPFWIRSRWRFGNRCWVEPRVLYDVEMNYGIEITSKFGSGKIQISIDERLIRQNTQFAPQRIS
jgi:hypothetical protein